MVKNIRLNNITPFSDFFFKDCMYQLVFTLFNFFDLSILPIILYSDIFLVPDESSMLGQKIIFRNAVSFLSLLEEMKVEYRVCYEAKSLLSGINSMLCLNIPTIVSVDCYYEAVRMDTYQRKHLDHTILVYGILDNKYLILEHEKETSLIYKPMELSEKDLIKANEKYIERYLNTSEDRFSFFQIISADSDNLDIVKRLLSMTYIGDWLYKLTRQIRDSSEMIFENKLQLKLSNNCAETKVLQDDIDTLLSEINQRVNLLKILSYVMKTSGFGGDKEVIDCIRGWNLLQVAIVHYGATQNKIKVKSAMEFVRKEEEILHKYVSNQLKR